MGTLEAIDQISLDPQKDTSENALITPEKPNQDVIVIEEVRQPEMSEYPKNGDFTHLLMPDTVSSSPFPNGLTATDLAKRLGITSGPITRNWDKGADHFAHWSRNYQKAPRGEKQPDPDNLAWIRVKADPNGEYSKDDRYFPILEKN